MVRYGQPDAPPRLPTPTCPKCGSVRTQVIGRLEDGRTLIVRCNACGSHSTLVLDDLIQEFMEQPSYAEGWTSGGCRETENRLKA